MRLEDIFSRFTQSTSGLKVLHVASCDLQGHPNSAPKMLIDIAPPDLVYFLEYRFTTTFHNITVNPRISVSIMDEETFTGYRLSGPCVFLEAGPEMDAARKMWASRLIRYEADRVHQRILGNYSTRYAENRLPEDFVIVRMTAIEGAMVKPDRIFRSRQHEDNR